MLMRVASGKRYVWKRGDKIGQTSAGRIFIGRCARIHSAYTSVHLLYG